jgi:hypothetical protein
MAPRQRATFDKLQKERARREKQAQKRARRQAKASEDQAPLEGEPDAGGRTDTSPATRLPSQGGDDG